MDETRYEEFVGTGKELIQKGDQIRANNDWWTLSEPYTTKGRLYRRPIQATEPEAVKDPSPAPGSDTPRTDAAQVAGNIKNQSDIDKEWPWSAINRGYDFARTLERENTTLREEVRVLNELLDHYAAIGSESAYVAGILKQSRERLEKV